MYQTEAEDRAQASEDRAQQADRRAHVAEQRAQQAEEITDAALRAKQVAMAPSPLNNIVSLSH